MPLATSTKYPEPIPYRSYVARPVDITGARPRTGIYDGPPHLEVRVPAGFSSQSMNQKTVDVRLGNISFASWLVCGVTKRITAAVPEVRLVASDGMTCHGVYESLCGERPFQMPKAEFQLLYRPK